METSTVALTGWQVWALRSGKLLLTLLLAWQSSQLLWTVIAPTPLLLKTPASGEPDQTSAAVAGTAAYHLFGIASDEKVVAVVQPVVEAPETRLRLTLLGVTLATQESASSAIIAANGREADFFKVGDIVDGRTRLSSVQADRVILDTSGKLETLKFADVPGMGSGSSVRPSTAPLARPERTGGSASGPRGNLAERLGKVKSAEDFVEVATEELADDPLAALGKMGLEPRGDGEGYEVKPGSMLLQFQLKPGDIVLSVNDQMVGDPGSDQSLLEDLKTAESVRIEVQRGDNRFVVNHRLN